MQYLGKLDKNIIGKYATKITTEDVVITEERRKHIYEEHSYDYELILGNIDKVVLNPSEVIEDLKHKDTVFLVGKLEKNYLNIIVKLNTTNSIEHPQNSVMTAWIMRERNLKKLQEKNKTIYKRE